MDIEKDNLQENLKLNEDKKAEQETKDAEKRNKPKKLKKGKDSVFFGVCSGIGEYANIDPTIVRLFFAFMFFGMGTGLGLYLILALVMPESE